MLHVRPRQCPETVYAGVLLWQRPVFSFFKLSELRFLVPGSSHCVTTIRAGLTKLAFECSQEGTCVTPVHRLTPPVDIVRVSGRAVTRVSTSRVCRRALVAEIVVAIVGCTRSCRDPARSLSL